MKCTLCGNEFDEKDAKSSCKGCVMARKCRLLKCPNCGFEMPEEPGWIKRIRQWRKKKHDKQQG